MIVKRQALVEFSLTQRNIFMAAKTQDLQALND